MKGQDFLLLDSEGFFSKEAPEIYDAKLFAVTTLLSSVLLYNDIKTIDQARVDYLELLASRTQFFALKSHSDTLQFPEFVWYALHF